MLIRLILIQLCCVISIQAQYNNQSIPTLDSSRNVLFNKGKYQEALPFAIAAAEKAKGQDSLYAAMQFQVGRLYDYLNDYTKAEPIYLEVAALQKKTLGNQHPDYARSLNNLGILYGQTNRKEQAETHYQQALDIYLKLYGKQHAQYAGTLNNLAIFYYQTGQYAKALPVLEEVLAIRKVLLEETHPDYSNTIGGLAVVCFELGRYKDAINYYEKDLVARKKLYGEQHPQYALPLIGMGQGYNKMGDNAKAEKLLQQALGILTTTLGAEHPNTINAQTALADVYASAGRNEEAESIYLQLKKIYQNKQQIQTNPYVRVLMGLGLVYNEKGFYTDALMLFEQASAIYKNNLGEKHSYYAGSLNNIAMSYWNLGQLTKAEQLYLETAALCKELLGDQHVDYARIINNLALVYAEMKRYEEAENYYKKALDIWKNTLGTDHELYAQSLQNLGLLCVNTKQYERAHNYYEQALAIFRKNLGENHQRTALVLNNIAATYLVLKQYAQAEESYQKALAITSQTLGAKHPSNIRFLSNLAGLYRADKRYHKAEPIYSQAQQQMLDYLLNGASALNEKERQHYFKTVNKELNLFNSFAALHRSNDSLLIQVQNGSFVSKSYSLSGVSELLPLIKKLNDPVLNKNYSQWLATKNELAKAYSLSIAERKAKTINIDSLEQIAEKQESELMRSSALFKERLNVDKKTVVYEDLKAVLGENEAAIDFIRFNTKGDTVWYYALLSTNQQQTPIYIPLCLEKDLALYVQEEIALDNESYITNNKQNKELYKLLFEPILPYLKNKEILHLSLVGLLNQVAMGVLSDANNKMLMKAFELHYYSSLKDFVLKRQGNTGAVSPSSKEILLLGNAAFDLKEEERKDLAAQLNIMGTVASRSPQTDRSIIQSVRFSPLLGTKVEIEQIEKFFVAKRWEIHRLEGKEALEEHLKKVIETNTPTVLHFATHGFFFPTPEKEKEDVFDASASSLITETNNRFSNPLTRVGIALAGANQNKNADGIEDGLWTAYEVANTNLLGTNLVVLSACETGRGDIDPREGVIGLQRAFKIAGAKNVLVSLWKVPDAETAELMQEFYKYYLKGESPSQALAKAQTNMQKKYEASYYWAAFVLIE